MPAVTEQRMWPTLTITSVVGFMVSLEITVIALALPEIRSAFPGTAESTLSWIITAYNIGLASLLLVAGWASDRFGRKLIFLAGLTLFSLGSLGAGLAPGIEALIGARVFQSIGGAMQLPAGLALLLEATPPQRRQFAIGIWGAMGGLAAAIGPPLGGLLIGLFGWRSVFLVNVPVALVTAVAGVGRLRESRNEQSPDRVDLISVPLASIGVGSVILGIVGGSEWGWLAAGTVAAFVVGAVLVVLFVIRSRRHPEPLFDLDLFKVPSYTLGNLGSVVFVIAFFAYFIPLPTFLQEVWGWGVVRTGLVLVPGPLLAAFVSPVAGRLADRHGVGPVLAVGAAFGVLAMILQLTLAGLEPSVSAIIVPGLAYGVAAGCSFAMLVAASMRDVPPPQYGMGGAGRTTVFQLGLALAIALAVALIGRPENAQQHLDAVRVVWVLCLAMYAAQGVIFGLLFPKASAPDGAPTASA
jgi:EmrB/QacA subfamily drug resistance transporter